MSQREAWGTRIGLILAAAGNAIGIGNLLRFPNQAAANGGGAFMIPYIISLLVLGIPMMWVLWAIGRYGGTHGSGNLPGIFDKMWPNPASKYIGVIGVSLPLLFVLYYSYIEAWCLGYAWFSFTGDYLNTATETIHLGTYYREFLGDAPTAAYFPGLGAAFAFMAITLGLNLFVLYRGVAKGIEVLAKIAIPLLFVFCMILIVRVFTATGPGTVVEGLNFIWTPKFDVTSLSGWIESLKDPKIWLAAAGQIFFTLSIGFGAIEVYASYVREDDDIALTGLTTAATNEFVEVIFGSMIAIPAAAVFFGAASIKRIADSGPFAIGMVSMPEILRSLPLPEIFGTIWFLLLFFAAFTSSVAVSQPIMSFFQDEMKASRGKATLWLGTIWALGVIPVILFYKYGFFNEYDFWAGTLGLVVIALIEVILFAWIFGITKGFAELDRGAFIRIPRFFKPVIQFVIPVCLVAILGGWIYRDVIQNKVLQPKPVVDVWVANPAGFTGEFITGHDTGEADQAAAEEISQRLAAMITEGSGDGEIQATVAIHADGTLSVAEARGSGAFAAMSEASTIETYLRGKGYAYVLNNGESAVMPQASEAETASASDPESSSEENPGTYMSMDTAAVTVTIPIIIRGLYTTPYIWLARASMLFFTLLFAILIWITWKNRGKEVTA